MAIPASFLLGPRIFSKFTQDPREFETFFSRDKEVQERSRTVLNNPKNHFQPFKIIVFQKKGGGAALLSGIQEEYSYTRKARVILKDQPAA